MTKAEIVERLLADKHITASEAVTLLENYGNVIYTPPAPYYIDRNTDHTPPPVWCSTNTNNTNG